MQAIGQATIVIEDNSITEFVGDNSNGKSILSKTLQYILSGDISDKDTRRALIKDGQESATLTIEFNEKQIGFVIKEEWDQCIVLYRKDKNNDECPIIKRTFREGGLKEFIHAFGFRCYANGDICLQLHPTWGAIPFVTTSGRVNDEIVQDIVTDKIADSFLESFSKITYPMIKDRYKNKNARLEDRKKALANMKFYDYEAFGKIANELRELYSFIKGYKYSELTRPTHFVAGDICGKLKRPTATLKDLCEINSGVCPTCKRPFFTSN